MNPRHRIDAVFFDFAGTLFSDRDLRDAHLEQLRFVAGAAGVEATDKELRAAYRAGMASGFGTIAGAPSYLHRTLFAAAFRGTAEALGGKIDEATAAEAVKRQYAATVAAAKARPDALDTLRQLRESGRHVQIVSNIDEEQLVDLVDALGLNAVIDAATSSEAADSCKPDPGIFVAALAKAGASASATLFVGDSVRHDVVGAAAVGLQTAWLRPEGPADATGAGDTAPDYVVTSLRQVLEIVEPTASRSPQ